MKTLVNVTQVAVFSENITVTKNTRKYKRVSKVSWKLVDVKKNNVAQNPDDSFIFLDIDFCNKVAFRIICGLS